VGKDEMGVIVVEDDIFMPGIPDDRNQEVHRGVFNQVYFIFLADIDKIVV
jgi:hypothetical protein